MYLGLVFGVDPDFQKKGVEGAIILTHWVNNLKMKAKYKNVIITWIGDFNPKMIAIIENLGTEKYDDI